MKIPADLANQLTIGRMFLLPPIIILLFLPWAWAAWLALLLFIIGAATDWLDGWIARTYNQQSEFGRFLDPISDKIFVITILIMLVAIDRVTHFWVLAILIIIIREFIVAGLREFLGPKEVKIPVTNLAKWKTTIQMVATGILIIAPWINGIGGFVTLLGLLGLSFSAALTAYTGWQYLKTSMPYLKG